MNVDTIKLSKGLALRAYRDYSAAVKARHSKEDEALKNAYREIYRGGAVIDITTAFRNAGQDERERPRIAIAKAHWPRIQCHMRKFNGSALFGLPGLVWDRRKEKSAIALPSETFRFADPRNTASCSAQVPMIPAGLRPEGDLSRFHILWEAEWSDVPVDPYLLKHLGGPFYAILAQWDLTPLEQAVMRMRV